MYYKSYINIDLVPNVRTNHLLDFIAKEGRFKLSNMDGNDHAHSSDKKKTIFTCHSQDLEDISQRVRACVEQLNESRFPVLRYKIEQAVIDSRIVDVWNLLPG